MSDTTNKPQLPRRPMFPNPNDPVDREALQRLEDKLIAMGAVKVKGTGETRMFIPMHRPAVPGVIYGKGTGKEPKTDNEE